MATIKDIADKAGVSTATVSNVIKGKKGKVSEKTIEKIEKIIEELNYVPSMGARILSEKRSKIIGVICNFMNVTDNSLKDPFTAELLGVIESYPQSAKELMQKLNLKSLVGFRKNYLQPALKAGLIGMTKPDKPTSKNQKYFKV